MAPSTSSRLCSSLISGRLSLPAAALSPKPGSPLPPLWPCWPAALSSKPGSPLSPCSARSLGNSPWGNSPRSPPLGAADGSALFCALDSPALGGLPPASPWLPGLLEDELLAEELLEDELLLELLEELLLELLDELLLEGLLGGGVGLGGVGVCGVVGLLALGHPLSNKQTQASPASVRSGRWVVLFDVISPDKFFSLYWFTAIETRPERGFAQFSHQAAGSRVNSLVFIQTLQVDHAPSIADPEF